jgi:hypothetical protein
MPTAGHNIIRRVTARIIDTINAVIPEVAVKVMRDEAPIGTNRSAIMAGHLREIVELFLPEHKLPAHFLRPVFIMRVDIALCGFTVIFPYQLGMETATTLDRSMFQVPCSNCLNRTAIASADPSGRPFIAAFPF